MAVIRTQVRGGGGVAGLVTEVDASREFPNDDHVRTAQNVGLDGRCRREFWHDFHGTKIRKYAQHGAQLQQSLFGSYFGIRVGPLWSADGAEQDGVAFLATGYRAGGQWVAGRVNRGAAGQLFAEIEIMAMSRGDCFEDFASRKCYLRADAITGQ